MIENKIHIYGCNIIENYKDTHIFILIICSLTLYITHLVYAGDSTVNIKKRNDFLTPQRFIHICGPNPILQPGSPGAWDCIDIETADAFKDFGKYYLYYHGTSPLREQGSVGYRIGVAVADHPLGPFKRHGDQPILGLGPKGSWDDFHVACAMILKEGVDKYYMWYSGWGHKQGTWSIGLATADNPLGPWEKNENNPVLEDFGYVGGVVNAQGKYYMYSEHPIGSTGDDYAPLSVATADKPQGPWSIWSGNPVMRQGEWGEFDDGGISEAEVLYHSGVFHIFYGGAKLHSNRRETHENIGYAYSLDGYNFTKYGLNPIADRQANPNMSSMSEVHAVMEPPFIYLYHTVRYQTPCTVKGLFRPLGDEDIGVEVMVMQRPFSFSMPVLNINSLGPSENTTLDDVPPINLCYVDHVVLTIECTYHEKATRPLKFHIKSSYDGKNYDTADLISFDHDLKVGKIVRKTLEFNTSARFIKLIVENPDDSRTVSNLNATVTLSGL